MRKPAFVLGKKAPAECVAFCPRVEETRVCLASLTTLAAHPSAVYMKPLLEESRMRVERSVTHGSRCGLPYES